MGVGLGGSHHTTATMNDHSQVGVSPNIKEEAETSADSLNVDIDVEGHEEDEDQIEMSKVHELKSEIDPVQGKAWVNALRTHVVVPLIGHPRSLPFRKPVDEVALGIYPAYSNIITHPIDLGTIKSQIDNGLYCTKDELITDIQLVWNNAKKFNPSGHAVYDSADFLEKFAHDRIDKIKREGPYAISRPIAPLPPPRESSKRDARKKSLDLPGETQLPQHLEQNRSASGSMRACENLLRNLMTQKMHRDYVEPFIEIQRKTEGEIYDPMSLSKIQNRLRTNSYRHPLEFAADMRRIVTETYRYTTPKDPLVDLAGKLQSEFEMCFAKIDFQEDEVIPSIYAGLSEDDRFIGKLLTAQNTMVNIQTEFTRLIQDYIVIKKKDQKRRGKNQNRSSTVSGSGKMAAHAAHAASAAAMTGQMRSLQQQKPTKPPRPPSAANSSNISAASKRKKHSLPQASKQPSAKKAKTSTPTKQNRLPPQNHQTPMAPPMMTSTPVAQGMFKTRKNNLTMEEGHKLRNMIAGLSGPQQMTVIEILRENKEHLAQDEEGNVEMEFREFNQKSIDDLKSYVLSVTASSQQQKQPLPGGGSNPAPSGVATGTGNGGKDLSGHQNTTNDSDDSDSDDSSSSESSSDSDSD
jgi:hypothetical protein